MPEQQRYCVEIFVQDFQGKRTSLGTFEMHVENWTLCVNIPPTMELSNLVRALHLEFKEKVKP